MSWSIDTDTLVVPFAKPEQVEKIRWFHYKSIDIMQDRDCQQRMPQF